MTGPGWLPTALGLASATSWGAGDFCGGLAAKRTSVYPVVIGSQLVGIAALASLALALREGAPVLGSTVWCGLAGVCGAVGLLALYRALAVGRMGLAAPVSGILSAAVPVVAGALFEGLPRASTCAGFVLALIAVWLVSRTDEAAFHPRDLALPVTAGFGFGLFIVIVRLTPLPWKGRERSPLDWIRRKPA